MLETVYGCLVIFQCPQGSHPGGGLPGFLHLEVQMDKPKYFDTILSGIAYLNRLREVKPENGKPYIAVDANLLTGKEGAVKYVLASCTVIGKEAASVLHEHWDRITAADTHTLAQVRIGDSRPDSFMTNDKTTKHVIRGRLLRIGFLRLNGEEVFKAEPRGNVGATNKPAASPAGGSEESDTVVKLDTDDPEFEQKRRDLKLHGFRWNPQQKSWVQSVPTATR